MFSKGCRYGCVKLSMECKEAEAQRGTPASRWWQSQRLSMGLSDCKVRNLGKSRLL